MLEPDSGLEFDRSRDEEFFAALPARPAVFLLQPVIEGAQPYVARTADLRRAAERLLRTPEAASKRLNLRNVVRAMHYRVTGSKFEQWLAIYELARAHFPRRYRGFLRLRTPALLKVNLRNEYPRCYVTRRIAGDQGFYFGPFASRRSAQAFSEGFLDLFKARRCQIKIRRDPSFPGCIYSEMKMCLAPCFAGCTKEEYGDEVGRLLETLETGGASLERSLEREREAASESLDFERAAAVHKKIEKASSVLKAIPGVARRVDGLDAIVLQRSAEPDTVMVFVILSGLISRVFPLRFGELSSQPRSVEHILREQLQPSAQPQSGSPAAGGALAEAQSETSPRSERDRYGIRTVPPELPEHLALLARWFYSNPREGEIFFNDGAWPYRRIIRACSRILAPKEPA
jgi:excinuclease ABC subunit C